VVDVTVNICVFTFTGRPQELRDCLDIGLEFLDDPSAPSFAANLITFLVKRRETNVDRGLLPRRDA
jgi:hypothetical protein